MGFSLILYVYNKKNKKKNNNLSIIIIDLFNYFILLYYLFHIKIYKINLNMTFSKLSYFILFN